MRSEFTAEVLPTHTPDLFQAAVARAADLLRAGEVVALPTETVYGLAANAMDARAVAKIFEIKGRPANNPVIVHVAGLVMARRCVCDWPEPAARLAAAFWPGPLTLVLTRAKEIPDIVTAGGNTVGVRWPSHPFIQAVIRACGFPLAAPSANLSSRLSPTNAEHVRKNLSRVKLIVDGGQAQVGIESTVLDLSVRPPRVLRPGMIRAEVLAAVVGEVQSPSSKVQSPEATDTLRSPGMLERHYAPKARLAVLAWKDEADLKSQISSLNYSTDLTSVIAHSHIPSANEFARVSVIPHDPESFARAIYAELHRCDGEGSGLIVVEAPPATAEWRAILDRLKRASTI